MALELAVRRHPAQVPLGLRTASRQSTTDQLFDVLASLPHRQRAAIVLKYYEQRTEAEIAPILGCRQGTVGPLVSRGLASLRTSLTSEGGAT